MPKSGDKKTVTTIMYENEIIEMKDAALDAYYAGNNYGGLIAICEILVTYLPKPFDIASEVMLEFCDFMGGQVLDYYWNLYNAYNDAQSLMTGAGPILYYDVKQKFVYVVKGSTGAWIADGSMPTFIGHYDDY
ncbi:MAG TPA: hypothetical protein DER56_02030 [Thermosipho africanus]|nr:hypothetical protein [Thermosipho africanus]